MTKRSSQKAFVGLLWIALCAVAPFRAQAQQILGAINGTVTDASSAVIAKAKVQVKNLDTGLTVTAATQNDGSYNIADLPIGTYTVTLSKDGFRTEVHSSILVRGNLATTVNAVLQAGEVTSTVTVTGTPLMNQTDTTNGYTLGTEVIENTPPGTGSFTQLAILAPGVNADLLSGSGANSGLGNQDIFANGQRDTSNSFSVNSINSNNIFNGMSSSQVSANRFVLNTGESGVDNPNGEIITTSVYDAIGQALPTPPPETIEELHVTTSMYDASQGANSGAHIELVTKSGTNDFHGGLYEYHQTTGWDASPFFFNANGLSRPTLHRNTFGGMIGGPILRNKLFFFGSYQGQRLTDGTLGTSFAAVPPDLGNPALFVDGDRGPGTLANVANTDFGPECGPSGSQACTAADINPVALQLLQAKNANGSLFIPDANDVAALNAGQTFDATIQGQPSTFNANQVNANIDYDFSAKDRLSTKYYYQNDPTVNSFTQSELLGFPNTLNAGSQVVSVDNTTALTANTSWEQRIGFVRETVYGSTAQGFSPSTFGINLFGQTKFPQIGIGNVDGFSDSLSIGPSSNFANAGIFQNGFEGATSFSWFQGLNSLSAGFSFDYTQLNVLNQNNQVSNLSFVDFPGFLQGNVCGPNQPSCVSAFAGNSELLNGATNRYFRAKQVGFYGEDDIKLRPNLTVDVGVRWDWDGPLVEKNGFLTNFYPQDYSCGAACATPANPNPSGQFTNIGLVVAGNNKTFGTAGVSPSTLSGRQWGFAPRFGVAWSPSLIRNFVVRAGVGMYYDRGEFFSELSPSAGGGISGPFGVTTEEPFVVPVFSPAPCASGGPSNCSSFATPFGTQAPPPPPQNLSAVATLIPNIFQIENQTTTFCQQTNQFGCGGVFFGGYDPTNKLPYSENWTVDLQWQPKNAILLDLAYVGNHGVHQLLPIPFNQPEIATPASPINGQTLSYGYNVGPAESLSTIVDGFGTGNAALRVPFVGFDPNSDFWEAEGISHYNALQLGVTKRLSHGLQVNGSYTWSHTLDEGSGLSEGLFYNGNNPLDPASAYGNSGFDRTHVFTVSYLYQFPTWQNLTGISGKIVNGWGVSGITVAESGQPYSVIDFSGGVASIYFGGGQDAITNPIVPIGAVGSTTSKAVAQGTLGVDPSKPLLNPAAFGVPILPCNDTSGVPSPANNGGVCDTYETGFGNTGRDIFRGPFQVRFDSGLFKNIKINERFALRYDAQFFNIFNHPSFDTPNNNVEFNPAFGDPPIYGPAGHGGFAKSLTPCVASSGAYACPPGGHLGVLQHTIGSPRFIQMSLHLTF